jgi:hypothetical protein
MFGDYSRAQWLRAFAYVYFNYSVIDLVAKVIFKVTMFEVEFRFGHYLSVFRPQLHHMLVHDVCN